MKGTLCCIALALVALAAWPEPAAAVSPCGGESDTMVCGAANPCGCCARSGETWPNGTCGNCVWHAWHMACNGWGVVLPWACTDARLWNDYAQGHAGYTVDTTATASSIFVCEASSTWSEWGHVGWIVSVNTNGSSNTTEQFCSSTNCGTFDRMRAAGFADSYIHHGTVTPPDIDDADFVSETIPDGTQIQAGTSFVKRWTMRNTGNTTWTRADGYTWDHVSDEQFGAAGQTALPAGTSVAPGSSYAWDVAMTAPSTPGTYRGNWRMNHAGGGLFGDNVWIEIVVVAGPTPDASRPDTSLQRDATALVDDADFVSETIPDGTQIQAGTSFVKRWTMRNTGNTTWTSANGYTWDYVSNERFGAAAHTELAAGTSVAPGSSYAWDVTMTAPSTPGTYRGYWRMNHSGSGLFGDNVWIEIVVVAGPAPDAGQRDTRRPDTAARDTAAQPEAAVDGGGVGPGSDGGSGPGSDGGSPADGRTYDNVVMSGCACGAAGDVRSKGQALWLAVLLLLVTGSRLSSKRRR